MRLTYSQLRSSLLSALAGFLEPLEAQAETSCWFEEGLGRSRAWLALHGGDPVLDEELQQVARWLERRRHGEPWAYILGWAEFRGLRFEVNRDTLIPRPETEQVLEAALDLGRRLGIHRVCDIGTGSGILAVCLVKETDWIVSASDISHGALGVARRNAERLDAGISFFQGDLLDAIPDPLGLVVSNPPYVDPADRHTLQRELDFEPAQALFAGDRGLALSTLLLRQAMARAASGCVLEIGSGQGDELRRRGLAMGWRQVTIQQDIAGHDRVLLAMG